MQIMVGDTPLHLMEPKVGPVVGVSWEAHSLEVREVEEKSVTHKVWV